MPAIKIRWKVFLLLLAGIAFLFLTSFLYFSLSPRRRPATSPPPWRSRGARVSWRSSKSWRRRAWCGTSPFYYALAILKRSSRHIRAGEYELASSMSPNEIIGRLVRGMIKGYRVTIPEDWSLQEISDLLSSSDLRLVKRDAFLAAARDPGFLEGLNIQGASAEGYLFPNTYIFDRTMGPREIIKAMVHQFWKAFTPEMRARADEMGCPSTRPSHWLP
jgi:UPF0755 protein